MFDRTVCVSIFRGTDVQSGIVCGTVTRVNSALCSIRGTKRWVFTFYLSTFHRYVCVPFRSIYTF